MMDNLAQGTAEVKDIKAPPKHNAFDFAGIFFFSIFDYCQEILILIF